MSAAPAPPPAPGPDPAQFRAFWRTVVLPGSVHEVRIPNPRDRRLGVVSGYFGDEEAFVEAVASVDGRGAEAVYCTLNPLNPALFSRVSNCLKPNAKPLTSDVDVPVYRNLLIDIDPVRPSRISATDAERVVALTTTDAIVSFLIEQGWPDPIVHGSSGNGGLLIYRLRDLPTTPENTRLVKTVLESLASLFNTPAVKVDTSVANPSRLVKVIGTVAAKGDHTQDRPWRRAEGVCRGG
ncbi:MAG: hypothetical protein M3R02_28730 [Chloroflexota bacterium]|nr:hypothetical protein [Chloroflexota bacterium]